MAYVASDELIELIWHDLHRLIPRRRVAEVAYRIAAGFADARITAFIPIFVRRATRDGLLPEAAAAAGANADQADLSDVSDVSTMRAKARAPARRARPEASGPHAAG
jgi:hypothetical protein